MSKVAVGGFHTCALLTTGALACWGDGARGQVGHGDTSSVGTTAGQMGDNLTLVDVGPNRAVLDVTANLYQGLVSKSFSSFCGP